MQSPVYNSLKLWLFSSFCLFSCLKTPKNPTVIKIGDQIWSFQEVQDYMELRLSSFQEDHNKLKEEILKEIVFYSFLKNWAKKNSLSTRKSLLTKEERLLFVKNKKKLKALKIFKTYLSLKQALIKELEKKTPPPSIEQQKSFYAKNKAQFIEPAQCQLQQILASNQKLAQSLHQRIKAGESFSALNKVYSLKENPGWVKKGQWALFDKACFEEEKSLSPVLKSPYGFHIFLRTGKKAARQKSFLESQKEILKILKKRSLPPQLKNWLREESLKTPFFKDKKLLDQIKIQYKRKLL